ncbi:polysaccharide biosynthesis protein [Caldibacillus lycopersici]|uniref:Polysaccharide biosynthesis protein n=1 Tax=Perspicuibacillus lycopersici TaxID=1325689 RepID=A0AAE3IRX0_9BACI|nr:nucleoside-diphosphate sugar epimerase/dehydratase [Perspicuibacillus lycopersici]MCU9612334.1 polysaccharide biosynthesis protein [Perspicuibacillus lycopersici]
MTYKKRFAFLAVLDSAIVLTSIYVSMIILNIDLTVVKSQALLVTALTLLLSHHMLGFRSRLYHKAWEYASINELRAIYIVVTISIVVTGIIQFVIFHEIAVRALAITWMLHLLLVGSSRFVWRMFRDSIMKRTKQKRTLIVGAGRAGTMVVRNILKSNDIELFPVGYVDDDPKKYDLDFLGIPVLGNVRNLPSIVEKYKIEQIVIAIPSLSKMELKKIVTECSKTAARTQIIPKIEEIMLGKLSLNSFRDVQENDLLGREPVELDINNLSEKLQGKTILVTGAGGSIGSEICRQISLFKPKKLVLVGHGENSIYQINAELTSLYERDINIVPVIADIQDRERIFEIMEEHIPQVVYHAAAHKHVPLMEFNPKEAIKNNIIGTKIVSEAAGVYGADTFVLISTDKAVNPANVMGATKRCAELIIQELDQQYKTKYVAVRFGNVLGSRGSVVPLFKQQIQNGGPITVTHPEMTRYFMTIPEASKLVIQAGALAQGGEIFVLDMGKPVKIRDLAENLIKLSGYTTEEIGIVYSGIRPGEKMYEELLNENEIFPDQLFPKIHIGKANLAGVKELYWLMDHFGDLGVREIKDRLLTIANMKENKKAAVQAVAN